MPKLSKEKLNEIKQSKNYTAKYISEKTGIPKSTVEKIFGGFNKNPTFESLQKIADVFGCGIDDFMEFETEPDSPFYTDRMVMKLVHQVYDRSDVKQLLEVVQNLDVNDVNLLISLAKRLKN